MEPKRELSSSEIHRFGRKQFIKGVAAGIAVTAIPGAAILANSHTTDNPPPTILRTPTPKAEDKSYLLTPDIRDQFPLETYGDKTALSEDQLQKVYEKINKEGLPLEDDTYYGTVFIRKFAYDVFNNSHEENIQDFLKRHEAVLNKLLKDGSERYKLPQVKFQLRRLMVIDDAVNPPNAALLKDEMNDTDGVWMLADDSFSNNSPKIKETYAPENSSYYDKTTKIDRGLLHEFGHVFLHLGDQYHLYIKKRNNPPFVFPEQIQQIPEKWQEYDPTHMYGADMMISNTLFFNEYTYHELARRIKNKTTHYKGTWAELAGMAAEIPDVAHLHFGAGFSHAKVEIFRRTIRNIDGEDKNTLSLAQSFTADDNGSILASKDILFPVESGSTISPVGGEIVSFEDSVLFIKVTNTNGLNGWRWIDIRPFNTTYWKGYERTGNMFMKLAGVNDQPEGFAWKIRNELPTTTGELDPQVIDGIETYGATAPIDDFSIPYLLEELNSTTKEKDKMTYYESIFVSQITYDRFKKSNTGESFQQFVHRHVSILNKALADGETDPDEIPRLGIRRIIIHEPRSYGMFQNIHNGKYSIADSDEYHQYTSDTNSPEYFDNDTNTNFLFLSKLQFDMLSVPMPGYLSFYNSDYAWPDELGVIPESWKKYDAPSRPDISNDLCVPNSKKTDFGMYARLLKRERVAKGIRNKDKEQWARHKPDIPKTVEFDFGADLGSSNVVIYRSVDRETNGNNFNAKALEKVGSTQIPPDGKLSTFGPGLFKIEDDGYIKFKGESLFLKVTDKGGKGHFRWMDIRDFNIPYWIGGKEHVTMKFNLATKSDDPVAFNWKIDYSELS